MLLLLAPPPLLVKIIHPVPFSTLSPFPPLMNEPAKATGRIAETLGRCFGGKALDEVSAEGFVLALAGGFGLKEVRGEC
jgi:hypothetical protein